MEKDNFQGWDDEKIFEMECMGSEPSRTSTGHLRPHPTRAASYFFTRLIPFVDHHRKAKGYVGRPETYLEQPIMKYFGDVVTFDFKPYKVAFEVHGDVAHPEEPCLSDFDDFNDFEAKY